MAVRLSALCAGCPLPPGIFLVLISVRCWVDPRGIVQLERLGPLKKKSTSLGFDFDIIGDNCDWICDLPNITFVCQARPQHEGHANIMFQQEGNVLSWWKMPILYSTYQVTSFQINQWMGWAKLISWSTCSSSVLFFFWAGGGVLVPNSEKLNHWSTPENSLITQYTGCMLRFKVHIKVIQKKIILLLVRHNVFYVFILLHKINNVTTI
jgi:hypothetical protein